MFTVGKNQIMTSGIYYPGPQKGNENGADKDNMEEDGRERKRKKAGWKSGVKSQRRKELVDRIVFRPYVPHGTKTLGEGVTTMNPRSKVWCT